MDKELIDSQISQYGNIIVSDEYNDMYVCVIDSVSQNNLGNIDTIFNTIKETYQKVTTQTSREGTNQFGRGNKKYLIKAQFNK
jgi:rRNA processing protein Gar1